MSDVATARNSKVLAKAKELLSKRAYYRFADAYNTGDQDSAAQVLENSGLAVSQIKEIVVLQVAEIQDRNKVVEAQTPMADRLNKATEAPAPAVEKTLPETQKAIKADIEAKAKKAPKEPTNDQLKAALIAYDMTTDKAIDKVTMDAIVNGTKDVFGVGAQKTFWLDIAYVDAGKDVNDGFEGNHIRKEAHVLTARKTKTQLITVFKFGKRQLDMTKYARVWPFDDSTKLPGDRRILKSLTMTHLGNGETLLTWVQDLATE